MPSYRWDVQRLDLHAAIPLFFESDLALADHHTLPICKEAFRVCFSTAFRTGGENLIEAGNELRTAPNQPVSLAGVYAWWILDHGSDPRFVRGSDSRLQRGQERPRFWLQAGREFR